MLLVGVVVRGGSPSIASFIPWLPEEGAEEAGRSTSLLVRDDHLHRRSSRLSRRHHLLRLQVPGAADDEETGADPRPHEARDRLDGRSGRSRDCISIYSGIVLTSTRRSRRQQGDRRHRPAVRLVVLLPGEQMPASGQLVLQVGQPVRLSLTSKDVIHSFWVPQLRMKQDVVPGTETLSSSRPRRSVPTSRLHRALRARALDDALPGGRPRSTDFETWIGRAEIGWGGRGGAGRRGEGSLHRQLRVVPHACGRGLDRSGRTRISTRSCRVRTPSSSGSRSWTRTQRSRQDYQPA